MNAQFDDDYGGPHDGGPPTAAAVAAIGLMLLGGLILVGLFLTAWYGPRWAIFLSGMAIGACAMTVVFLWPSKRG